MLYKIGNIIFNAERLIDASFRNDDKESYLSIRLAGASPGGHSYTVLSFKGETARVVWQALTEQAKELIASVPKEERGPSNSTPALW
ncbi:hypothetical protein [Pyrinomonas methylaliphatogenes]|jgi:hypothetical protein|uniref:Uncharacterized protein n=1 Tax=Pyrinomonas methylaliphatogenes TaxID=454194 RepID=A0A0B6WZV9_9BACT|nr:hypothetical protein [Pyrinomonas methylaliphatogenes]MBX5480213.1 hypothetical protein [Pyrinomonas methylaliphatogenes]CDM65700.1 hypothetical protein PYK22_01706 [Pyrinomonas methylaliphatogenes]